MKQYQSLKTVHAEPCSLGYFIAQTKRDPYAGMDPKPEVETEGYIIMYADGYKSWCPKSTFERDYHCAETPADRVVNEINELYARWAGLNDFIGTEHYTELSAMSQKLLQAQAGIMQQYGRILDMRLPIMNGDDTKLNEQTFDFGTAIKLLKAGALVCRKGWNGKGMFVVKQVPAHINHQIIPKMQSLPEDAKKVLMGRENPHIDYTSQCLLVQKDGRADSWVPSISDVFAEDWQIYTEN